MVRSFLQQHKISFDRRKIVALVLALSLLVTSGVFWWLRLIGLTKSAQPLCGKTEHTHSEECTVRTLTCDLTEEDEHIHNDNCYTIIYNCDGEGNELEEHVHELSCYSDVSADVETAADWEATLPQLSGNLSSDIVEIATSQLGVSESIDNYIVDELGEVRGITRYGQWYGNPYGEWSAMFACFCLKYAGVTTNDIPFNSGCYAWCAQFKNTDFWANASTGIQPYIGGLAFFDTDNDYKANTVGIITAVTDTKISVIQGDLENAVALKSYKKTDTAVLGYVSFPRLEESDVWNEMDQEEQIQYVISLINDLPSLEEVQERMEELEDEGNTDAMSEYYESLRLQVDNTVDFYRNLSHAQQVRITNLRTLNEYAEMFDLSLTDVTAAEKVKAPNSELVEIEGVDTSSFIKLNLYDYGDNINEKFVQYKTEDNKSIYPGFQQNGGARTFSRTGTPGKFNMNFGDSIVTDEGAGIYAVTDSGSRINSKYPTGNYETINLPASIRDTVPEDNSDYECKHYQVMNWVLDEDGYPSTYGDNKSLKYLFNEEEVGSDGLSYAKKVNTANISGLFKYDSETGFYTYNSRINHAQFDADTNTFRLFEQKITPNFIMYPFGNFLPLNDIETQTTKSSTINNRYFKTIAQSCKFKANGDTDSLYDKMATALDNFRAACNQTDTNKGFGSSYWTAYDLVDRYLNKAGINTRPNFEPVPSGHLDNIYNIDYDEETNFFFGLEMKMKFVQSRNGVNSKGEDMILKFTGDDDVLFYIDDVLFLDLSGIHRHVGGEIDFKRGEVRYYPLLPETGDVAVDARDEAVLIETFDEILTRAGRDNIAKTLTNGTFPDYSTHTLNWYYMERGSGSGVCRIEFNLEQVLPSSIYKVNQYGEAVEGAGFSIYKAEKQQDNTYKYKIEVGENLFTYKTAADVSRVDPVTGDITFNDNTVLQPVYRGTTSRDGSMVFVNSSGETMSMNDMSTLFGDNFIMREYYVPPGYRVVADESWMTFDNGTLICENTLDSGTWAAPNATVMAAEKVYNSDTGAEYVFYQRRANSGDIQKPSGIMFAVATRKCSDAEPYQDLGHWHPITGNDFDGYEVGEQTGVQAAINAAKTYVDDVTGVYTHEFAIGQMLIDSNIKIGMLVTINELPGEPGMYYKNVLDKYKKDNPGVDDRTAALYALANSRYNIAYYYSSAESLDLATPNNTHRVTPDKTEFAAADQIPENIRTQIIATMSNYQLQWSADVQVPNIVNNLYFQKTDITGRLIDNAVFGLYEAVKGPGSYNEGFYKADLLDETQYYVRLDVNSDATDRDAIIYNSDFSSPISAKYSMLETPPNLTDVEAGLIRDYTAGIITVTALSGEDPLTLTLTPAKNGLDQYMLGYTHNSCSVISTPGTGHFQYLLYDNDDADEGRYFLKELYAPEGYMLARENVKVVVCKDGVYANAGTRADSVMVGNGPGYLVKTLHNFATKGSIADSLCWIYGALQVTPDTEFTDSRLFPHSDYSCFAVDDINDGLDYVTNGDVGGMPDCDPYDSTLAMIIYYEYKGKRTQSELAAHLFDYKINDRTEWNTVTPSPGRDNAVKGVQDSLFLWTKSGWSDLFIYQDTTYGNAVNSLYPHSTYQNISNRNIVSLFSSSTVVRITDDGLIHLGLVKQDGEDNDVKLEGAGFVLKMVGDNRNAYAPNQIMYYDKSLGSFRPKKDNEQEADLMIMTDEDGILTIRDPLAPGQYVLTEIQAPAGYRLLTYSINIDVTVNINGDNPKVTLTATRSDDVENPLVVTATPEENPTVYTIYVDNYSGYELPATGSCGVYPFYITGIMLITFSAICAGGKLKKKKQGGAGVA